MKLTKIDEEINEEIDLTREEVDDLEEAIVSLKNYGRVHFKFSKGEITFNCNEFANLRERYNKDINKITRNKIQNKK